LRSPIEQRKRTLAELMGGPRPGIALNEHYVGDGEIVYQQACELGCEGIVSKRLGSPYRSGRSKMGQGQESGGPGSAVGSRGRLDVKRPKSHAQTQ